MAEGTGGDRWGLRDNDQSQCSQSEPPECGRDTETDRQTESDREVWDCGTGGGLTHTLGSHGSQTGLG